ncbi:hypothetical protein EYC84_009097 [Monilinia fructicola]|uniref:Uncharacterized protein n=1 Tax=Monilinia fructicola TaxID=38448 RepID=A0A5M9JCT3_MONFR|nr:hypothetical protein EYC84_009097 [Monilinia fructicola]
MNRQNILLGQQLEQLTFLSIHSDQVSPPHHWAFMLAHPHCTGCSLEVMRNYCDPGLGTCLRHGMAIMDSYSYKNEA